MRILLAHNSPYYPSFGGGDKSNRLLMAALAARGHEVRVLARAREFGPSSHESLMGELESRRIACQSTGEDVQFALDGVSVRVFTQGLSLRKWIVARMHEWSADVILTSTDDPTHVMLDPALRSKRARVVYLIRALIALPFGPAAPFPSPSKTEALRRTDGAVGVSEYVAAYAREWGQLRAVHLPISLPDRSEYAELGRFENRFVTLINPCAGKGLAVFLGLAASFPEIEFAAVPTWGTTQDDLAALRGHPNVTVLAPTDDIDEVFRQTRVALVPSLWAEARSRIALEAMARGIPVLASDIGGMREAMLGMDFVLPVHPVVQYRPDVDALMVPVVEVPEQDLRPWIATLRRLVCDREHYEDVARRARAAATAYAASLSVGPLEEYLKDIVSRPTERANKPAAHPAHSLSAHKRRLIALRLKQGRGPESA